ncbi:MAG: hypothetical protein HFH03_11195 [Dorea sp.]|jgi:hypothetical protein|nr:hypothetical protein [Dorea sp.]
MRQMMLIVGAMVELAVLWFRAEKKLTVDFAGLWGILGALLIVTGAVSSFSDWVRIFFEKPEAGLLIAGILFLSGGFFISIKLSELKMKNQELAIYVSLLLQENERIMSGSDERTKEDSICHQYDGARRGGDGFVRTPETDRSR